MDTYIAFTIQVYEDKLPNGTLTDYAEVQVVASTEEEAIKKAKLLLVRKDYKYRVKTINEYEKVGRQK